MSEPLKERTYKEPTISDRGKGNKLSLDSSCIFYNGSVEGLAELVPREDIVKAGWNKQLPVPLSFNSKVYSHPDQTDVTENYTRIIHETPDDRFVVSILTTNYFLPYLAELPKLPDDGIEEQPAS